MNVDFLNDTIRESKPPLLGHVFALKSKNLPLSYILYINA